MEKRSMTKEPREARRQRKRVEEGRGTGHRDKYQSFIQVERAGFQSRGRSHMIYDEQVDRHHHLLSDLELLIFIWAWSCDPLDIREQFPLQLFEFDPEFAPLQVSRPRGSLATAAKLGLKHPGISKHVPRIMTTDFVVTFQGGTKLAIHAKYQSDLEKATMRQRDLRKIEQSYWRDRNVRFMVMTEQPFTWLLADQLMWAIDGMNWAKDMVCLANLLACLDKTSPFATLEDRLYICSEVLRIEYHDAVLAFKYAVLTRRWLIKHLQQELDLSCAWTGHRAQGRSPVTATSFRRPGK